MGTTTKSSTTTQSPRLDEASERRLEVEGQRYVNRSAVTHVNQLVCYPCCRT